MQQFTVLALCAAFASAFDTAQTHEYSSAYGKGWGYLADDKRTGYFQEERRHGNGEVDNLAFDPAQTHEYSSAQGKGWGYLADDKRTGYFQEERRHGNGEDENLAFDPDQAHVYTQAYGKGRGYLTDDYRHVHPRHPAENPHYDAHWDFEESLFNQPPDQRFHTATHYQTHVGHVVEPVAHVSPDVYGYSYGYEPHPHAVAHHVHEVAHPVHIPLTGYDHSHDLPFYHHENEAEKETNETEENYQGLHGSFESYPYGDGYYRDHPTWRGDHPDFRRDRPEKHLGVRHHGYYSRNGSEDYLRHYNLEQNFTVPFLNKPQN